jgi:hypothetical protein
VLSCAALTRTNAQYGRIRDIAIDAKQATVYYRRIRYAAAARNCLDGVKMAGRTLHILYEERHTTHAARDWAANHPRIVLPILAVLLGGLSFLIFDPIRSFFVESKVLGRFDPSKYRALTWIRKETIGRLGLDRGAFSAKQITGIEKERQEAATMLDSWLKDWPDGFIVITGPRGSGKEPLLDSIVQGHPWVCFSCAGTALILAKAIYLRLTAMPSSRRARRTIRSFANWPRRPATSPSLVSYRNSVRSTYPP